MMAEKIDTIAESRHVTANRAIVDLLADAITAYEQRRTAFLELADRFQKSTDPAETKRLRKELARMTFGSGIDSERQRRWRRSNGHRPDKSKADPLRFPQ
jgi:hypothetical protein